LLRLGLAAVVGAVVGLNRDLAGKPAGVRTHGLVALGAALVTYSSMHFAFLGSAPDGNAVTRTVQGVIAGVGFLGGGVILKTNDRPSVRGLTTAASIWLVACLGVAAAAGQWAITLVAVALALLVLVLGGPFERWVRRAVFAHWPRERERQERRRSRRRRARRERAEALARAEVRGRARAMRDDDEDDTIPT
jgi:putative Mg2+ transporter-C (MgtC) family protein